MEISYAEFVSTGALCVGLYGLYLHHKRHKQDKENLEPDVSIKVGGSELVGWYKLEVHIRNNDTFRMNAERITIIWPPSTKIARYWDCFVNSGPFNEPSAVIPTDFGRFRDMSMELAQAGQPTKVASYGRISGTGDADHEDFFASVSPSWFSRILRSSSSNHASQRTLICLISMSSTRRSRSTLKRVVRANIVAAEQVNKTQEPIRS